MLELARTIRFCVPLDASDGGALRDDTPRSNTFAGWPSMDGIGVFCEVTLRCRGEPDPATGFLIDSAEVDRIFRAEAMRPFVDAMRRHARTGPAAALRTLVSVVRAPIEALSGITLRAVEWKLTPFYHVVLETDRMSEFLVSQQFDFAAAHRLEGGADAVCDESSPGSDPGKCYRLHGHNYRLAVEVRVPMPDGDVPARPSLPDIERAVDAAVLRRFDHRDLNREIPELANGETTVERIARVCHDLLVGPIEDIGGRLERVRLWETNKTSCSYPA